MPFEKNSDPPFVDELLTEVAEGYFGRRRKLDESITMLHEQVELLKQKESTVNGRAGYLNYLLLSSGMIFKKIKLILLIKFAEHLVI